jgi:hypothetical protein
MRCFLLQEFDRIRSRAKWMQVGQGDDAAEDDCWAHGTSMLSLVAGTTVGVAKNIDPVLVRMPCRRNEKGQKQYFTTADWIDGLSMLNDELDGSSPSVVLMASYWIPDNFKSPDGMNNEVGFSYREKDLLDALASKGAVLITGSGNAGVRSVNGWPASHGKSNIGGLSVPSLLVVGGVSSDGVYPYGNTDIPSGLPHVYAPGDQIKAVDSDESFWNHENGLKNTKGTSCSAALTAGLAAYYLRLAQLGSTTGSGHPADTNPQTVKDYIVRGAWSRMPVAGEDRPGIWNEVETDPAKEWSPNTASRRSLFGRNVYA